MRLWPFVVGFGVMNVAVCSLVAGLDGACARAPAAGSEGSSSTAPHVLGGANDGAPAVPWTRRERREGAAGGAEGGAWPPIPFRRAGDFGPSVRPHAHDVARRRAAARSGGVEGIRVARGAASAPRDPPRPAGCCQCWHARCNLKRGRAGESGSRRAVGRPRAASGRPRSRAGVVWSPSRRRAQCAIMPHPAHRGSSQFLTHPNSVAYPLGTRSLPVRARSAARMQTRHARRASTGTPTRRPSRAGTREALGGHLRPRFAPASWL